MLLENMLLMAAGEVEVEEPLEASTENFLYVWGQHVPFLMVDTPSTPKSWTAIAFGTAHAIGIQSNGTLWSWGNDGSTGALGRTYRTNHPESPTQIGTASNWSSVGAGEYVSAAITNTGALYMWGRNTNGQLGQGNITNRSSPVVVSGTWSKIVCGLSHVLAIKSDGKLFAWGWNGQGQLGDGTTLGRSSPVQIGASNWLDIGGGQSHTLAIRSDSKLFAWGGNAFGQVSSTKDVTPSWKQISAGYTHTLAIDQNGGLWAWGSNSNGQIGAFVSGGFASTPVRPTGTSFSSYTMVSAGYLYSTAIRVDGRLQVWGVNSVGQLGDGARLQVSSPKLVHNASYVFVAAAQGTGGHTHAINTLGQLISWGQGSQGQLGHGLTGTLASRSSPVLITTPTYSYIAVASGQSSSVAITENSTQYCLTWGGSASGEGGRNNFTTYSRPTLIFEGSSRPWVKCAIGATHVAAVASGDVFL